MEIELKKYVEKTIFISQKDLKLFNIYYCMI